MHSFVIAMLESQDPDDTNKLRAELERIKDELFVLNAMTESQLYETRKTVDLIIESRIKFL